MVENIGLSTVVAIQSYFQGSDECMNFNARFHSRDGNGIDIILL